MKHKAVFLDKDAIFAQVINTSTRTADNGLNDDTIEGLQRLQSYGYLLVVVYNQSGLPDGNGTSEDLSEVKNSLYNSFAHLGIYLDGFYHCPNDPLRTDYGHKTKCDKRKPVPGLILRAIDEMEIDLSRSWMIGDILNDVEAGHRAGCKAIMINNGSETRWASGAFRFPEYFAGGLAEASKYIVASEKMKKVEQRSESEEIPKRPESEEIPNYHHLQNEFVTISQQQTSIQKRL